MNFKDRIQKMNDPFNHEFVVDLLNEPDMEQVNTDNGRYYILSGDDTKYYSATTFLSKTKSEKTKKSLERWAKQLGKKSAEQFVNHRCDLGNMMHGCLEQFSLNNNESKLKKFKPELTQAGKEKYKWYKKKGIIAAKHIAPELHKYKRVLCSENKLVSKKMGLAGTVDFVGETFDNVIELVDFKSSSKEKREEYVTDYKLQCIIYMIMIYEMYNIKITRARILISTETSGLQKFGVNFGDPVILRELKTRLKIFKDGL